MDGDLKKEALHDTALERLKEAEDGWSDVYREARDDIRFYDGEHWEKRDIYARQTEYRPYLTLNKIPSFVSQSRSQALYPLWMCIQCYG